MYAAAKRSRQPAQISHTHSVPAPVGGWNARDPLAAMDVQDAVILKNFFPLTSDVMLRFGHSEYATGMSGTIQTLAVYEAAGGSSHMFAAVGTNIYDVTAAGAVGAAVQTGLANAQWQWVDFQNAAGNFLLLVNGADSPRLYNGAAWITITGVSAPAITGVTTSLLVHVHVFKRRIWFVEINSTRVWYLPTDSMGGAANSIDLGPLMQRGGNVVAISTWTVDAGEGMDDYWVAVTSEGEIVVYRGTDPASASTFTLQGVYQGGYPIGRRCLSKYQGDCLLIGKEGLVPLSKAIMSSRINSRVALTDKIAQAMGDSAAQYATVFGWQTCLFPESDMLILNVPTSSSTSEQYVMNTNTGNWGQFTGWNAACWALLRGNVYFGGDGKVFKAWDGFDDNGSNVVGQGLQAFNYFGKRTQQKHFKMARPILSADSNFGALLGLNTDFDATEPTGVPSVSAATTSLWDSALWDQSTWGGSLRNIKDWQYVGAIGYCAALHMKISTQYSEVRWSATDYVWEDGGVV